MEYVEVPSRIMNQPADYSAFAWILLLPIFFLAGWFTSNVYRNVNSSRQYPAIGIGGGPGTLTPEMELKIYELSPDLQSLPANISPAPDHSQDKKTHTFEGQSKIDEI